MVDRERKKERERKERRGGEERMESAAVERKPISGDFECVHASR